MTDQEQEMCDMCHERPATVFDCNGNTGESSRLCRTCHEQTASPTQLHLEQAIRNGKCQYCGGPASSGSMKFDGVTENYTDFMCNSCTQDLTEFSSRPENALPDRSDLKDKSKEKEVYQRLMERKRRQEEFMRQRIRERQT
jgi:hypothetical protein